MEAERECKLLMLRGLAILVARLPYTGFRDIEVVKDTWLKEVTDFFTREIVSELREGVGRRARAEGDAD